MQQDNSETIKYIVFGVIGVSVLALGYFGVIKPILNAVGLTDDKDDRKAGRDKDQISRQQTLSPLLFRNNRTKISIGSGRANQLANNIYKGKAQGWGNCCDDEALAVGSITSAGSKVNISYIADVFQRNFGTSLETFLFDDYLEDEHILQIDNYIDKVKNFK